MLLALSPEEATRLVLAESRALAESISAYLSNSILLSASLRCCLSLLEKSMADFSMNLWKRICAY